MSNWLYQQRKNPCHPNPYAFTLPKGFFEFVNDYLDADFQEVRLLYEDGVLEFYVEEDSWNDTTGKAKDVFSKNPAVAQELKEEFSERSEDFLAVSEKINQLEFAELSNEGLYEWHMKYINSYERTYPYGEPLAFLLKSAFTDELKQILKDRGVPKEKTDEVLQKLITPRERSFVNEEEYQLAKIAAEAEVEQDSSLSKKVEDKLQEHTKQFRWIPYDYGVDIWEYDDFKERLIAMKEAGNVSEKIKELENYSEKIKRQQEKLFAEYNVSEKERRYFAGIRMLTHLNDTKKKVFTRSHLLLRPLQDEMADRLGLSWDLFSFLTFDELAASLKAGEPTVDGLEDRYDYSVLVITHGKEPRFVCGSEAKELAKEIKGKRAEGNTEGVKEIEGNAASSSVYTGTVKVLDSAKEIDRIEEGDVLVTVMTSPDYTAGMKKAGAIVTDEGGVTSHAAIVSRELDTPCVIGTQNATKILEDGDKVQVSAEEGVVKIIDIEQ